MVTASYPKENPHTPIVAKVFESLVFEKWVTQTVLGKLDDKQFGGIPGTTTTDVLVEMVHKWYDIWGSYVRSVMVDYNKAFDLINHHILIQKLEDIGLAKHIVRWMASFLLDRVQMVKIGDTLSPAGQPNGGVPRGTLSGPKSFLIHINELQTRCPLYKYVDDGSVFEVCNLTTNSNLQESFDMANQWTKDNDMRINGNKTEEMIIFFLQKFRPRK